MGNTSLGIYKNDISTLLIDVQHLPELQESTLATDSITVGASLSVSHLIALFEEAKTKSTPESANVSEKTSMEVPGGPATVLTNILDIGQVLGCICLPSGKNRQHSRSQLWLCGGKLGNGKVSGLPLGSSNHPFGCSSYFDNAVSDSDSDLQC